MGHGPTQPIKLSNFHGPGPSHFQRSRQGPARPVAVLRSARPGPAQTNGPWQALIDWNCPHSSFFRRRSTTIVGIVGTIDLGDGLLIGIVRTDHFGYLSINLELSGPLITETAYKLEFVWRVDSGHFQSKELVWTIGRGGGLSFWLVWTMEFDAFQLSGNRDHKRQLSGIRDHKRRSIAVGNY